MTARATVLCQSSCDSTISVHECGYDAVVKAPISCSVQLCLGRPRLRTYAAVSGTRVPLWKATSFKNLLSGCLATFPSISNCDALNVVENRAWPARARTLALLTLETNEWGIPSNFHMYYGSSVSKHLLQTLRAAKAATALLQTSTQTKDCT